MLIWKDKQSDRLDKAMNSQFTEKEIQSIKCETMLKLCISQVNGNQRWRFQFLSIRLANI